MKVVVFGAEGWAGRAVLANLLGRHDIRAAVYSPESWGQWRDIDGEWRRAGASAEEVIREFLDRVQIFHFKDVTGVLPPNKEGLTAEDLAAAVEIGEGDPSWISIVGLIQDHGFSGWIVVEQDSTKKSPAASSRQSREYLRDACGI